MFLQNRNKIRIHNNKLIMARVDSFDCVVEIDLDVDLDLDVDNSNIEMNNSDNSSQSPPTLSEFSDPSVSGYQLEQNYFSSDDSDNDFYEIETDSNEEELPTYPLTNFEMTIFLKQYATPIDARG